MLPFLLGLLLSTIQPPAAPAPAPPPAAPAKAPDYSREVAAARTHLDHCLATDHPIEHPVEAALAIEALSTPLANPDCADLEVWKLAAAANIHARHIETTIAAYACEAIVRLRPDYRKDEELSQVYDLVYRKSLDPIIAAAPARRANLKSLLAAAEGGDPKAMAALGLCYQHGDGAPRNEPQAQVWYQRSADKGCPEGQYRLGAKLRTDAMGESDDLAARAMLLKAASAGHTGAMIELGRSFDSAGSAPRSRPKSLEWFRRAAEAGDVEGMKYYAGILVIWNRPDAPHTPADYAEAAKWLTTARGKGDAEATRSLIKLYLTAPPPTGGVDKAVAALTAAADAGDAQSMRELADLYSDGEHAPTDDKAAAKWWKRAADAGDEFAARESAFRTFLGIGCDPDEPAALATLRTVERDRNDQTKPAADAALYNELARMVILHPKLPDSGKVMVTFYRKAADLGDVSAMTNLAQIYAEGDEGVPKDPVQAKAWRQRAKAAGAPPEP